MHHGRFFSAETQTFKGVQSQRSAANLPADAQRQSRAIELLVSQRNPATIGAVAQAFRIPVNDTERITFLLQDLFDGRETVNRQAFEPLLDELTPHENHAFEMLWCYFKVFEGPANRVVFLNALQHLISRIRRPKHALRFLLSDFCRLPQQAARSDRYAIMLANILLRTYNKELDVDIEMTPEEVLNVRNGLDRDVVHYAQFRIDAAGSRFTDKVRSVHARLVAVLKAASPDRQALAIRPLLELEREIFIFLALLSGKIAHQILRAAVKEYGDPRAGIYRYTDSVHAVPVFLQQLKIVVRGVGRVGSPDDVALLRQIRSHVDELAGLDGTPENRQSIVRITEWIETIIRSLRSSGWSPALSQEVTA
jgi:hypothetical protein